MTHPTATSTRPHPARARRIFGSSAHDARLAGRALARRVVLALAILAAACVFPRPAAAQNAAGSVAVLVVSEGEPVSGARVSSGSVTAETGEDGRAVLRLPAGTREVRVQALATRLRTLAAELDRRIRLTDAQPLTGLAGGETAINWALTSVAWLIAFVVLLLSATGIHALMSFTVSRRTREIGIRTALGAGSGSIVQVIFSRAFFQIGLGVLAAVRWPRSSAWDRPARCCSSWPRTP